MISRGVCDWKYLDLFSNRGKLSCSNLFKFVIGKCVDFFAELNGNVELFLDSL